jgi:valine dehydrogenase (NAD+)
MRHSVTDLQTASFSAADGGHGRAEPLSPNPFGHEQVTFCADPTTGLRAIVAIYNTTLGPALGGTRFYPYADDRAALEDVL